MNFVLWKFASGADFLKNVLPKLTTTPERKTSARALAAGKRACGARDLVVKTAVVSRCWQNKATLGHRDCIPQANHINNDRQR